MKRLLFGLIILVAVFFLWYKSTPDYKTTNIPVTKKFIDEQVFFDLVQRYRFENNLSPYKKSDFLCDVAKQRLIEVTRVWSHKGFEANRFCPKGCTMGENLVKGFNSEQTSLKSWLNSPLHKSVLDDSFTHSCLKSNGNETVQIFGYY